MSLIGGIIKAVVPTKAKLQNVVDVLKIAVNPFSKDKIAVSPAVTNTTVRTVLSTVANNPYKTAAAVALVANPVTSAVISSAVKQTAAKIGSYAISSPVAAVKTTAAAAVIAGGGLALVPKLYNVTKKATQTAVPVLTGEKPLTKESLPAIGDTVGSALGFGAAGVAIGAGAALAYDYFTGDEIGTPTPNDTLIPSTKTDKPKTSDVPLTPSTQILGKPVGTSVSTRRKTAKKMPQQTFRFNIINAANSRVGNRNYISHRALSWGY